MMQSPENNKPNRCTANDSSISSMWIAATSFLRGLRLFIAARPKTPLRVLCIMAFDTLHVVRTGRKLSVQSIRTLATLLDFGACANAALDSKTFCPKDFQETRQTLEHAGIGSTVNEYVRRIQALEQRRPLPGGDRNTFSAVRAYREDVVRLSLGMLATTTFGYEGLDEGLRAIRAEHDLALLFRIVMQCQVIDDVVDFSSDTSAELPSFLTATDSLSDAFELTYQATRSYGSGRGMPLTGSVLPFRIALRAVSAIAILLITLSRWQRQIPYVEPLPERAYGP